nr:hypothetical protein [Brevibacillus agri]
MIDYHVYRERKSQLQNSHEDRTGEIEYEQSTIRPVVRKKSAKHRSSTSFFIDKLHDTAPHAFFENHFHYSWIGWQDRSSFCKRTRPLQFAARLVPLAAAKGHPFLFGQITASFANILSVRKGARRIAIDWTIASCEKNAILIFMAQLPHFVGASGTMYAMLAGTLALHQLL